MRRYLLVLALFLFLPALSHAATFCVSKTGNDANTGADCTDAHAWQTPNHAVSLFGAGLSCGDTVEFKQGNLWTLPTLQGGIPWSIGTNGLPAIVCTPTHEITFQVQGGNGICTQATPSLCPVFVGATNIGATVTGWSRDHADPNFPLCQDDGVTCNLWVKSLTAASTQYFENLFYNAAVGGLLRRFRSTLIKKNGTTPVGSSNVCRTGTSVTCTGLGLNAQQCANVQCGCASAGVGGANCAVQAPPCSTTGANGVWQCRNLFEYKASDIDCSWHDITLGDIHIKPIESWSMEDLRLFNKSSDGTTNSCTTPSGTNHIAFLTSPAQPSPSTDTGFIPGSTYIVSNVREAVGPGEWILDRCPTTANCTTPDATWKLYIAAMPGTEDPTTDDVWIPQQLSTSTQVLSVANSSGLIFKGLNFEMDNYTVPYPAGLRDIEGMPAVDAMVKFTGTTNVTLEADIFDHCDSWCIYVHGGSADWSTSAAAWLVQDNSMYDSWGGIFGYGDRGCNLAGSGSCTPDSNTNVPSFLTFQNNAVEFGHREEATGESTMIYMGDGHNNLFTHNDCFFFYAGCVEFGKLLNRDANGPSSLTAGFMYSNTVSWNRIKGQINDTGGTIGVNVDVAGIHSAANNSTLCPLTGTAVPTGWPFPSNRAQFCNFIEFNWVSDIATDPNNLTKHGGAGIYPDQGSTYMWIHNNLVTRVSQDCVFQHLPGTSIPAPGVLLGQFAPTYVDYSNNIFALCGALELPGRGRAFQIAEQNQNAAAIHGNIFFQNSSGGVGEQPIGPEGASKWGAFDYTQTSPGNFPIALTALVVYDKNLYWDVAGLGVLPKFFTCNANNTGCNLLPTSQTCLTTPCYTEYSGIPWACTTGGCEDPNSTIDDPHFIKPIFGTGESWIPTNVAAMTKIGFVMWDYTQAGRFTNMIGNGGGPIFQIPAQPQNMPTRFMQASNYMPTGFTPGSVYIVGNATGTGHFAINTPTAALPCSISVTPPSANVVINATQQFTPTFSNCAPATATWSVNGVNGGDATHGTVSGSGLYTAPATIPVPANVTVTATATADPTKIANSVVTILPSCSISILPVTATVQVGLTQSFTGTTSNCSPSTVIYSVNGVIGGTTTVGTIDTTGLYTAPLTIPTGDTFTSLTGNNTPQGTGFVGTTTTAGGLAETQQLVPPTLNDNVTGQDIHTLLYGGTGYTQEVACELQPWWGQVGHISINQNDLDSAHIAQKLTNMKARGCTSVWVDTYAKNVDSAFEDNVLILIAAQLATGSPAMKLVILYDQGSLKTAGTNWDGSPFAGCPQGASDQTTCINTKIQQDYDHYNTLYFNQSYYLKSGGKPVVPVFVTESLWSGTNWTTIWGNLRTHTNTYAAAGIKMVFRNNNFSHTQSDGAYAWPPPTPYVNTNPASNTQFCWQETDGDSTCDPVAGVKSGGFHYLDDFYTSCLANPTKLCYGGLWKGFDWSHASWMDVPKVIAQQAGLTFLYTIDKFNQYFTTSAPVNGGVQIGTWDDYEEGTEVESGIDNTYRITSSIASQSLSWVITPNDATFAQNRTIDHFNIYYQDGVGAMHFAGAVLDNTVRNIPTIASLIPPGSWTICVQAVGAPMMMNQMSNCTAYSIGIGGATPQTVTVTATSAANKAVFASASVNLIGVPTGENSYALPNDICNYPSLTDGPATLPTRCFYTARSASPTGLHTDGNPATTWSVANLTQWNTAVAGAVCGDVISIAAGTVLTGSLTTPGKTCDSLHWILITAANWDTTGPLEGARVTPCWWGVSSLAAGTGGLGGRPALNCSSTTVRGATITAGTITSNAVVTLTIPANTQYMRIRGLEITRPVGGAFAQTRTMSSSNTNENHIILEQVWGHGTTNDETQRFASFDNCTYCALINSFINDYHCIAGTGQCGDSQTISGGINPNMAATDGAWKIYNNFLESSAETIELGGGGADSLVPTDLEYRQNFMFKPLFWNPSPANASYAPPNGGAQPFGVKNHWETKNSSRVIVEGNVLMNNWTQGQTGNSITITPKSQVDNMQHGQCPSCATQNITVRFNKINTVNQPFQVGDSLSNPCTMNCAALAGSNYSIHDNVADNIGSTISNSGSPTSTIQGSSPTPNPGATFFIHDQTYNHNTFVYPAVTSVGTWPTGIDNTDGPCVNDGTNCTGGAIQFNKVVTNNIFYAGQSGFLLTGAATPRCSTSPNGTGVMTNGANWYNACYLTSKWDNNCVVGGTHTGWVWPGTNNQLLANAVSNVQFVNYNNGNGGDYHLQSSSPCHAAASDLKDMGADIDMLNQMTSGVTVF